MWTLAWWSPSWAHSRLMTSCRAPRLHLLGALPWSVSGDRLPWVNQEVVPAHAILTFDSSHVSVDHVTPQPGDSLLEVFEQWQEAADKKACCDYSLHVDIPQWNENIKDELELLVQDKGTSTFSYLLIFQCCSCCNSVGCMLIPIFGPISQEQ